MRNNIILLTIECLRKKDFDPLAHSISEIDRGGLSFENFYQNSPWTAPSFYSIFTSSYPINENMRITPKNYEINFPEILKKYGYHTIGLNAGGFLSESFGWGKGFSKYYQSESGERKERFPISNLKNILKRNLDNNSHLKKFSDFLYRAINYLRPPKEVSKELNEKALKLIRDKEPFFLWLHYPDTHEPYFLSKKLTDIGFYRIWKINEKIMNYISGKGDESNIKKSEVEIFKKLYRTQLKQTIKIINCFLEELRSRGILNEKTYTIITGDHGQQFMEHGNLGHGMHLYQELCNVPLVILNRNFRSQTIEKFSSGVDLAPTILDLAEVPKPSFFLGNSVFSRKHSKEKEILLMEGGNKRSDFSIEKKNVFFKANELKYSLIDYPFKLIRNPEARNELYNLKNDPEETENLISRRNEIYQKMNKKLKNRIEKILRKKSEYKIKRKIENLRLNH